METLNSALLTFLLNSLWQVPLIAASGWLASRLLKRGPAAHRCTVWILTALAATAVPLSSVRMSYRAPGRGLLPDVPVLAVGAPANTGSPAQTRLSTAAAAPVHVSLALTTTRILFILCFLGAGYRLAWLCFAMYRTRRILRDSTAARPSPVLEAVWRRTADEFAISNAELRMSASVRGPVMLGGRRKIVILPEALLQETDEKILTTAIGHEMAHIRRRDYELNILIELICLPISFQPATALLRRAITRTREVACDEMVTSRLIERGEYARSMLALAHDAIGISRPSFSLGVFEGNVLEERVKRLLDRRAPDFRRTRLMLATGVSALALAIVAGCAGAISARAQSAALPEMRLGAEAFNKGNYPDAAEHLQNAVNIDPGNINARLFLANALVAETRSRQSSQPGIPLSQDTWAPVLRQYEEVLARDPKNAAAIFGMATLGGPERRQPTRERLLGLIAAEPQNASAYYALGVMDWQFAFAAIRQAQPSGVVPFTGPIPDMALRSSLRASYLTTVDEGIRMIQTMLQLSPEDRRGLAYLNLLYREAAALSDTDDESKALLAKADDLVKRALAATQAQNPVPGAVMNVDGPPPTEFVMTAPPPPPPPPPPGYKSKP